MDIIFKEHRSSGYKERTIENAMCDATIAIAIDFNTAGERLTKKAVKSNNKTYIPIDGNNLDVTKDRVDKIVRMLNNCNAKSLNIAGNGIYTINRKYTQAECDNFVYYLLESVVFDSNLINKISHVNTGGQTGIDESGAKASRALGIQTIVLAPKGWKFRDKDGNDIKDEKLFKKRFYE